MSLTQIWDNQGQKDLERELKPEKLSTHSHWRESEVLFIERSMESVGLYVATSSGVHR